MISALLASGLLAPASTFQTPFPIHLTADVPLNAANPVAIAFEDYNGDKIKDLVLSYRHLGMFAIPNKKAGGFESSPEAIALIRGTDEVTKIINGGSAQFVDLDGDGILDIVTGTYMETRAVSDDGMAWEDLGEIQFLKGKGNGQYEVPRSFEGPSGTPILIDAFATVSPVHWDNDGIWDLVVSTRETGDPLRVYLGKKGLKLSAPTTVQTAGTAFARGLGVGKLQWASIQMVDWNGDGTPDLLAGNADGGVYVYPGSRNTQGVLSLGAGQTLVEPLAPETDLKLTGAPYALPTTPRSGFQAAVYATDWNGDGKLDLLVGDLLALAPEADSLKMEDEAQSWSERLQHLVQYTQPEGYWRNKYKHLEGQMVESTFSEHFAGEQVALMDRVIMTEDPEWSALSQYAARLGYLPPANVAHPLDVVRNTPRVGRVWVYIRQ